MKVANNEQPTKQPTQLATMYRIRHHTRFRYSEPIMESFMELCMEPLNSETQSCHTFTVTTTPQAQVMKYEDYRKNRISYFNVPGRHSQLTIKTEAVVEKRPFPPLPSSLPTKSWNEIDGYQSDIALWDYLQPSQFAQPTDALLALVEAIGIDRRMDPLTLLRWLTNALYETFAYVPNSTKVDSPIDEALHNRAGVCQDFSHIMLALLRHIGVPARYVSGYLYHRANEDRSMEDASHAWVEAHLPSLGWVGFDPTNNLLADERHICVAIGRDYADVPPTNGVFRGDASSELDVGVQVVRLDEKTAVQAPLLDQIQWNPPTAQPVDDYFQQQQQQQ